MYAFIGKVGRSVIPQASVSLNWDKIRGFVTKAFDTLPTYSILGDTSLRAYILTDPLPITVWGFLTEA